MNFKYPKNEKLKSKNTIDLLFSEGKSVSKYPLRLVYVEIPMDEHFDTSTQLSTGLHNETKINFGVSVSKKYFKKAVDRNYFKRVLRECYRLNKHIILENLEKKYAIMFFYQTKDRLPYKEIHEKTIQLFEKFVLEIKK
ncbi:MAG: ribonuclease P protein component [Flavobacterium sp.]|nr:ribonuclease P protein component [Flavobacterium sp.]